MGLLLMAWLNFCAENKKKTVFYVVLASCFHISALIFFVVLLFDKIQMEKKKFVYVAVLCSVFGICGKEIFFASIKVIGRFLPYYSHYLYHQTGRFALLSVLALLVALFCSQKYGELVSKNKYNQRYLLMLLLYITMLSFQVVMDEFNRFALFFVLAPSILLPNTLVLLKKQKRIFYAAVIFVAFSGYFFVVNLMNYNMVPYRFFWTSI